jgi:hypothetical protein
VEKLYVQRSPAEEMTEAGTSCDAKCVKLAAVEAAAIRTDSAYRESKERVLLLEICVGGLSISMGMLPPFSHPPALLQRVCDDTNGLRVA